MNDAGLENSDQLVKYEQQWEKFFKMEKRNAEGVEGVRNGEGWSFLNRLGLRGVPRALSPGSGVDPRLETKLVHSTAVNSDFLMCFYL